MSMSTEPEVCARKMPFETKEEFKRLLGRANCYKEGDDSIGVASKTDKDRAVARKILSSRVLCSDLHSRALLPDDAVSEWNEKAISTPSATKRFAMIRDWPVGKLVDFICDCDSAGLHGLQDVLPSELIAACCKLMSNAQLTTVGARLYNGGIAMATYHRKQKSSDANDDAEEDEDEACVRAFADRISHFEQTAARGVEFSDLEKRQAECIARENAVAAEMLAAHNARSAQQPDFAPLTAALTTAAASHPNLHPSANPISRHGVGSLGDRGYFGSRIQPNSATDDTEEMLMSVLEGLSYGCGDAILGVNIVSSYPASVRALENTLRDVVETFGLDGGASAINPVINGEGGSDSNTTSSSETNEKNCPSFVSSADPSSVGTRWCALAHMDLQRDLNDAEQGIVNTLFQSIGGTERVNGVFNVTMERLYDHCLRFDNWYFETGQGSASTNHADCGVDMVTLESRAYGVARAMLHVRSSLAAKSEEERQAELEGVGVKLTPALSSILDRPIWMIVNTVAGFIGPEVFSTRDQLLRACLEDCFMGKMHGLVMGADVCSTYHMGCSIEDMFYIQDELLKASPAFFMAVAGNNDPMLSYLTTSFRDHVRLRERSGLRNSDTMAEFYERSGVMKRTIVPTAADTTVNTAKSTPTGKRQRLTTAEALRSFLLSKAVEGEKRQEERASIVSPTPSSFPGSDAPASAVDADEEERTPSLSAACVAVCADAESGSFVAASSPQGLSTKSQNSPSARGEEGGEKKNVNTSIVAGSSSNATTDEDDLSSLASASSASQQEEAATIVCPLPPAADSEPNTASSAASSAPSSPPPEVLTSNVPVVVKQECTDKTGDTAHLYALFSLCKNAAKGSSSAAALNKDEEGANGVEAAAAAAEDSDVEQKEKKKNSAPTYAELYEEGKTVLKKLQSRGLDLGHGYARNAVTNDVEAPAVQKAAHRSIYEGAKKVIFEELPMGEGSYFSEEAGFKQVHTIAKCRRDYVLNPANGEIIIWEDDEEEKKKRSNEEVSATTNAIAEASSTTVARHVASLEAATKTEASSSAAVVRMPVIVVVCDGLNPPSIAEEGHVDAYLAAFASEMDRINRRNADSSSNGNAEEEKIEGATAVDKTQPTYEFFLQQKYVVVCGRVRASYAIGQKVFGGKAGADTGDCSDVGGIMINLIGERPGNGQNTFSAYIAAVRSRGVWTAGVDHDIVDVVSGMSKSALCPAKGAEISWEYIEKRLSSPNGGLEEDDDDEDGDEEC